MITKISRIYPVDFQKHDNPQSGDGAKKKQQDQFKDILANLLVNPPHKLAGLKK